MADYCYLRLGGLAGEDGDMSVESLKMYTLGEPYALKKQFHGRATVTMWNGSIRGFLCACGTPRAPSKAVHTPYLHLLLAILLNLQQ